MLHIYTVSGDLDHRKSEPCPQRQSIRPFSVRHFGPACGRKRFLTIFVLISQNRMAREAERRSHLDLQVGMLAEQELTVILQVLQKLCHHVGVDIASSTPLVQGFSETTDAQKLASELKDKLPDQ
jgi:hypothetical protein